MTTHMPPPVPCLTKDELATLFNDLLFKMGHSLPTDAVDALAETAHIVTQRRISAANRMAYQSSRYDN